LVLAIFREILLPLKPEAAKWLVRLLLNDSSTFKLPEDPAIVNLGYPIADCIFTLYLPDHNPWKRKGGPGTVTRKLQATAPRKEVKRFKIHLSEISEFEVERGTCDLLSYQQGGTSSSRCSDGEEFRRNVVPDYTLSELPHEAAKIATPAITASTLEPLLANRLLATNKYVSTPVSSQEIIRRDRPTFRKGALNNSALAAVFPPTPPASVRQSNVVPSVNTPNLAGFGLLKLTRAGKAAEPPTPRMTALSVEPRVNRTFLKRKKHLINGLTSPPPLRRKITDRALVPTGRLQDPGISSTLTSPDSNTVTPLNALQIPSKPSQNVAAVTSSPREPLHPTQANISNPPGHHTKIAVLASNSQNSMTNTTSSEQDMFIIKPKNMPPTSSNISIGQKASQPTQNLNVISSSSRHQSPTRPSHLRSLIMHKSMVNIADQNPHIAIYGTGKCQYTKATCSFSNCVFLLSPCAAKNADHLLVWHGCLIVHSAKGLRKQTKLRKVILVDMQRTSATVDFLKGLEQEVLDRNGGEKMVAEAYDWRLLESVRKQHQGKTYTYDVWKRCFMHWVEI
jgi:hypothetical protein